MTYSNSKEAIKKRNQRAKKLSDLSEIEIKLHKKLES